MDRSVPRLPAGECQVWWAAPLPGAESRTDLLVLLDERERARWERFRLPDSRALHLTAHALARLVLAAHLDADPAGLRFTAVCKNCGGPHGKPRVVAPGDWELSLSHSGRRVAVAVARSLPLGVDVEQVSGRREDLIENVLTAAERRALAACPADARQADFIRYWTRKESVLKATGDGLTIEPSQLAVSAPGSPPALLDWTAAQPRPAPLHLTDLDPGPGYRACLAVLGAPVRVAQYDAAPLLLPARAPV
ncbi:4'-phosphopantetheinyl transferase family protein [Streptomyces sp. H27-D2]|uniref:4'-phosphopantetheinyl transferase family protein n=1 Tax=Streptomyces sp. H27-D2 TaxID=3046304 RepID=UPI002DB7A837|nr:4'-phosphopantetheinyl transferase superfamily protein [Streptomyces sp. H27-D2]MEC4017535.1 4'-phosphopantetheinyl transferase superfamily protein [Streptomyces sp. H27-D2]